MDAQEVLVNFPFISPEEAAAVMCSNVSTARRRFQRMRQNGLATYHMVGRVGHLEQRWVLTREGLLHIFHAADGVPWWLKEPGLRSLYRRMEHLRVLYRLAPTLFEGAGRDWHQFPKTPRLTGCTYVRGRSRAQARQGPGLIQWILSYTQDISIPCCPVGTQLSKAQMRQRWQRRFVGLEVHSGSTYLESLGAPFVQVSDPQYDSTPHPSGYLVVAADELAFVQAYLELDQEGCCGDQPLLFVNAKSGASIYRGVVSPVSHDTVEDREIFDPSSIGNPGKVFPFDGPPCPEDLFGEALPFNVFELVDQWPGLRVQDIARLCRRSRKEVHDLTQKMVRMEWLQERGEMLYLGKRGMLYAARRDRVSPSRIQARVRDAIAQDHKPVGGHRRHTLAVNQVMIRLREAGIKVFPGWRSVVDIPGVTQLKPDLVMFAETPLGAYLYYIEVERTAVHPEQVANKLAPYRGAREAAYFAPAVFLTERPDAEELFRRQSRGLPVLTSTLADTRRGPLAGEISVWRLDGQSVPLSPVTLL